MCVVESLRFLHLSSGPSITSQPDTSVCGVALTSLSFCVCVSWPGSFISEASREPGLAPRGGRSNSNKVVPHRVKLRDITLRACNLDRPVTVLHSFKTGKYNLAMGLLPVPCLQGIILIPNFVSRGTWGL